MAHRALQRKHANDTPTYMQMTLTQASTHTHAGASTRAQTGRHGEGQADRLTDARAQTHRLSPNHGRKLEKSKPGSRGDGTE
eukprot:6214323-Pleurochrysis_carterae.AAC.2